MTKRIPFDLDMWLKNPELRVFTRDGNPVEIHYFISSTDDYKILGIIQLTIKGKADSFYTAWTINGFHNGHLYSDATDLVLEIPLKLKEFNLKEWLDKDKPDCYTRGGFKVENFTYYPEVTEPLGKSIAGVICVEEYKELCFWNDKGQYYPRYRGFENDKNDLMLVDED